MDARTPTPTRTPDAAFLKTGRVLMLAGPTAVGKSAIALALAERLGAEIISVDSMQVYRGMDIGTAKPSPAERARVPHHLLDVADVTETFDVTQFVSLARLAVAEIHRRGRVVLFCGGTGFYFKALLQGVGQSVPANLELRAELRRTCLTDLLRELAERDPMAYERIDRQNPRRVIRAVEVIRLTGKPISQQRADWSAASTHGEPALPFFGLARSTAELTARINARVDEMFRCGLVAETEQLLRRGLEQNPIALQALGYRQVTEHLHGERSLPETVQLVKIRTRQFAKRQMTWFRRQLRLEWLHIAPQQSPTEVAGKILKQCRSSLVAG